MQTAWPATGTSTEWIRLPSILQQKQKTSTASVSTERIRLPSVQQQN